MNSSNMRDSARSNGSSVQMSDSASRSAPVRAQTLSQLMGEVYDVAPSALRNVMIDRLVSPLGVLSLATVANGIFLQDHLRKRLLASPAMGAEQDIRASDVIALAERVLQINAEIIDEVAEMVRISPAAAGCAAAEKLAKIPLRRNNSRHHLDGVPRNNALREA